jgi:hypothetical protein
VHSFVELQKLGNGRKCQLWKLKLCCHFPRCTTNLVQHTACAFDIRFDSFGASQAVYRNLWYIEAPLWKEICLFLGWFVISAQVAKKINILTAQIKRISNTQAVFQHNMKLK